MDVQDSDSRGMDSIPPDGVIDNLLKAAPWLRFMAILGFVSAGLTAVAGLVMILVGLGEDVAGGRYIGLLYVAIAAVYLIPILPLHRSARTARLLRTVPSRDVAVNALVHQASFWRRLGILTAIGIGLALISILIAVAL